MKKIDEKELDLTEDTEKSMDQAQDEKPTIDFFEENDKDSKEALEVKEEVNADKAKNDEKKPDVDPRFVDKKGRALSDKKISKILAKEARDEQKRRQLELERKINEANKAEAKKNEALDEEEREKERQALRAQKIAKKLSRKRQTNMHYVDRFEVNSEDGLSDEQVNQRILEGFSNFKPKSSSKSITQILIQNIFTFFNILTFTIAGFLISVNAIKDCIFVVIITLNMVIGIIQEINAKRTIDQLSLISASTVNVLRNGKVSEISVSEVVLDDIMLLEAGKQISSDSVVVEGTIEVNESLLTGESDSIVKKAGDSLYSGSYVVSGSCKAKVDKVGKDNYIEALTTSAKKYMKPKSELLRSLKIIIIVMAIIIIPVGIGLFFIQTNTGMIYSEAIRKSAGAMVGMIPSGLFLCTSMALAVGVSRLGKKNVLVQELYCIEMLARINVLCLDKTGTITDGSMVVKDTIEYKNFGGLNTKFAISALLNALNDRNMTSIALEKYYGTAKILKTNAIIPFSSKRKFQAATFDKYGTFILGAPEFVLKKNFSLIAKDVDKFSKEGYRVLLLAYTEASIVNNELEADAKIEPMSLVLIEDNIRPDAIETIKYFKDSGVEVKVISGDNPQTVCKIAGRAGIENAENYISLDGLSEQDVVRAAGKYTVFGRVSPSQKRLLVKTLKELGKTVAMTGDGVNDILALKEADCSIAMASGSEAARNVSHLVLLDSNFGAMPSVVAEGRRVINNITKVSRLYLTKTIFSLLLAIVAMIKGYYPISTNQLFMIDMFCIGIPSVVLVLEKNNDLFKGHFLSNVIKSALPGAIVIVVESLIVFLLQTELSISQTATSTIIVLAATFTCEMVLFDVCAKPVFTNVHKILFYTMFTLFIFLSLVTPRFFDFSPVGSFGAYQSKTIENYSWKTAEVAISQSNTYVVDGYVLYKKDVGADKNKYYVASATGASHSYGIEKDGRLRIDDTIISQNDYNYVDHLPQFYKTSAIDGTHYYGINGTQTNLPYDEAKTVSVESDGEVKYVLYNENHEVVSSEDTKVNILPTITISDSKEHVYLINGVPTITKAGEKDSGTVNRNRVTIDSEYHVYVDNNKLYKSTSNGEEAFQLFNNGFVYGADKSNNLVVNMTPTQVPFDDEKKFDVSFYVSNVNYYINDLDTEVTYKPAISTTDAQYYIVNGYLTNYACKTVGNEIKQSVDSSGHLVLDGITTDISIDLFKSYGGTVPSLSTNCLILLVMLCLMSRPLMVVVYGFVPFFKKWIKIIMDRINKL